MSKKDTQKMVPDEVIMNKIYLIRGKKVMLDRDLGDLYEVETKQLKRAVRRNIHRFPKDFMFELTDQEYNNLRRQIGTSSWGGTRYVPMAFTEHGVIMMSSVLNSDRAIQANIQIVRIFVKMREMLSSYKDLLHKLEQIEHKLTGHDNQILTIFEYLKHLEQNKRKQLDQKNRKRIGYKRKNEQ